MKRIELMAPAGSKDAFIGAINAGANAVYLGGKKYGARAYADNFESSELSELVRFAHLRHVSVYVTVNTLIFDDEVDSLLQYTDTLVKADIDALIVQDLGMLDLLHRRYPLMPIHASTQMNAHNAQQVAFLKELGASRVILARETSIDTIKAIRQAVDIELEVFVHGALCVSYSGNCLFSSMVAQRSGNRGECNQSCRLPYTLLREGEPVSEEAYWMSTKDLMTIEQIELLIEAGVDAIKIEGRMRKSDYVIQSVLSYRRALDAQYGHQMIDLDAEIDKLKRVFNREYTPGYLLKAKPYTLNNHHRPNHMGVPVGTIKSFIHGKATICLTGDLAVGDGIRIMGVKDTGTLVHRIALGKDFVSQAHAGDLIVLDLAEMVVVGSAVLKTLDSRLVQSLNDYLDPDFKRIRLHGSAMIFVNQPMVLTVSDDCGHQVEIVSDVVVLPAKSAPLTKSAIEVQLSKLGNTPFAWETLLIKTDGEGFVPVKMLNLLRHQAIEQITELRTNPRKEWRIVTVPFDPVDSLPEPFELIAKIRTSDQLEACIQTGIQTIYYEDSLSLNPARYPKVTFLKARRRISPEWVFAESDEDALIEEVGSLHGLKESHGNNAKRRLVGGTFLNVTNAYTAALLFRQGLTRVTLSPELHKERVSSLVTHCQALMGATPNLEQIVYGRTELMISKYCPIAKATQVNKTHCHLCDVQSYALRDRMGYEFPLINDGDCNIRVLNSRVLSLIDHLAFFREIGIAKVRMDFTIETKEEAIAVIEAYQQALRHDPFSLNRHNLTTGRFLK
jgi:putative protease